MATKADFEQALTRLATGELTELVVQPADFMAFQQAYRESDLRTRIIGQARRGGEVHYHLTHPGDDQPESD